MRKILITILLLLMSMTSYSQGFYHQYQLRNIIQLQSHMNIHEFRFSLPGKAYHTNKKGRSSIETAIDSIRTSEVLKGTSDDAYYFYKLSSALTGRIHGMNASEHTREDIDTIMRWWRENVKYVSPDFMKDIIYYARQYSHFGFISTDDDYCVFNDMIPKRLNDRITYRKAKTVICSEDSIRTVFLTAQDELQDLMNTSLDGYSTVDALVPRKLGARYVYVTKKLMGDREYEFETAISRRELEDMMDWWFVNGCCVDNEEIEKLSSEWEKRNEDYFKGIMARNPGTVRPWLDSYY